jgi:antitoxin component YwqK of YwqJK toxin-antitoxin module
MSKGTHKNGKREGVWVGYNKDGTVDKEYTGTYKDGKKISD